MLDGDAGDGGMGDNAEKGSKSSQALESSYKSYNITVGGSSYASSSTTTEGATASSSLDFLKPLDDAVPSTCELESMPSNPQFTDLSSEGNINYYADLERNRNENDHLLTLEETTCVRESWDYLAGHVGIATLGRIFMRGMLKRGDAKRLAMIEGMEEVLFPSLMTDKEIDPEEEKERIRVDSAERGVDIALLIEKRILQACDLYRDQKWIVKKSLSLASNWYAEVKSALAGKDFKRIITSDIPETYVRDCLESVFETLCQGLMHNGQLTTKRESALWKFLQIRDRY